MRPNVVGRSLVEHYQALGYSMLDLEGVPHGGKCRQGLAYATPI